MKLKIILSLLLSIMTFIRSQSIDIEISNKYIGTNTNQGDIDSITKMSIIGTWIPRTGWVDSFQDNSMYINEFVKEQSKRPFIGVKFTEIQKLEFSEDSIMKIKSKKAESKYDYIVTAKELVLRKSDYIITFDYILTNSELILCDNKYNIRRYIAFKRSK